MLLFTQLLGTNIFEIRMLNWKCILFLHGQIDAGQIGSEVAIQVFDYKHKLVSSGKVRYKYLNGD